MKKSVYVCNVSEEETPLVPPVVLPTTNFQEEKKSKSNSGQGKSKNSDEEKPLVAPVMNFDKD